MKVILYMALTANGMIAKEDGNSDWVSPEDTKSFTDKCNKAGAVIMGMKTYECLTDEYLPLKKGIHVVITHNKNLTPNNPLVLFTDKKPQEILAMLEKKGYTETVVIGGQKTISSFLQENLIDEIYFDIEPLLFGKGMTIFKDVDFEYNLKLLDTKKLNENTVQLHYLVMK